MTATVTDIKGNTPGQPPAQKLETVAITVTGYYKNEDSAPRVQKLDFNRLVGVSDEETVAGAWRQLQLAGGIWVAEAANKMVIYPFGSFDRTEVEVSPVIGVTL